MKRRFEKHVSKGEECHDWTGQLDKHGYGRFQRDDNSPDGAHRVAYELYVGDIPAGLFVLHKCDRRRCVNPEHLFLGTHADNMADMIAKGRKVVVRGENHGMTPLTEQDVLAIRADPRSSRALAQLYSVSRVTISNVKSRRTWKHVK